MQKNDVSKFDLNLLMTFRVLMNEGSVTGAARALSLGQPAVSQALGRLRDVLGDPLFVRHGRRMEPTPFARALHSDVSAALDQIEAAVRDAAHFDPLNAERTFRLAMSDDVQLCFLPKITAALRKEMPRCRLIVRPVDYLQAAHVLDSDLASIVVAYLDKLPANAKVRTIRRIDYRAVGTTDALGKGALSLSRYCQQRHVLVTFAGDLVGYIDETLKDKGVARDIVLSVASFGVLPALLVDTVNIATVPAHVAATLSSFSALESRPLPFASPRFDLSMSWRMATDRDPGERILRDIIWDVIRKGTPQNP